MGDIGTLGGSRLPGKSPLFTKFEHTRITDNITMDLPGRSAATKRFKSRKIIN